MRVFVGLAVPEETAGEMERRTAVALGGWERARRLRAADMHVTLRFLGEVAEERVAAVGEAMDGMRGRAVELRMDGIGVFRGAGAIYAGVAPAVELMEIEDGVSEALARRGFARELRAFTPHVTLARMRHGLRGGEVERWNAAWEPMRCVARELVLYRSVGATVAAEARYLRLRTWDLAVEGARDGAMGLH